MHRPFSFFAALALLMLSACAAQPLPSYLMQPERKIYDQIYGETYLKGKITIGEVTYDGGSRNLAPAFTHAKTALSGTLAVSGYLTDPEKARYRLTASIRDAQFPRCFMGSCESGAAIDYTLTDIKRETIVYNDLLVVPYTREYSIFTADLPVVQKETLGGAIGENFAHLLHVLRQKKPSDLGG